MKPIKIFPAEPDYVFCDGEETVLIWRDTVKVDGESVPVLHTRERGDSGEIFDFVIFNHGMPDTAEDYAQILESAEPYEIAPYGDYEEGEQP